jgi:small-conductance mechanosensitive channel
VLRNPAERARFIATLEAIAAAGPVATPAPAAPAAAVPVAAAAPAKPAAKPAFVPIKPNSIGAQLLLDLSLWLERTGVSLLNTLRAATDLALLWQSLVYLVKDPDSRARLVEAGWRLALVIGLGVAVEWLGQRLLRRAHLVLVGLAARVTRRVAVSVGDAAPAGFDPDSGQAEVDKPAARRQLWSWQLLRRSPYVLLALLLNLLPLAAFLALAYGIVQVIDATPTTRLVILAVVNAYIFTRAVLCLTRALVAPKRGELRLLPVTHPRAASIVRWVRRIAVVSIFGYATAEVGLLLGLSWVAHQAMLKLVALVVHAFLVIMVLQNQRATSALIRGRVEAHGLVAVLRRRLADVWAHVAIFFIIALWLVSALDIQDGYLKLLRFFFATVLILVLSRLATMVAFSALDRWFRVNPEIARRYPWLESRAGRYHPMVRALVLALILALTAIGLLEVWGLNSLQWFVGNSVGGRTVSALFAIMAMAVVCVLVWEIANASIQGRLTRLIGEGHAARAARIRTLLPMIRAALLVGLVLTAGPMALSEIGVNIAPLLAGAGIVGVAIGFGSQKLVQDFITGIFLLLENAMQVGDWVTVAGESGTVEQLSIRTLRLRAGDGSIHLIPFSSVTTVNNSNRGLGNAAVVVKVGYQEDTDRVSRILQDIALEMRRDAKYQSVMLSDLQLWGVDAIDGAVVTISGQIVCTDAGRWGVQREFHRRLKKRFEQEKIEMPSTTQTVILRYAPGAEPPAAAPAPAPAPDAS